MAAAEAEIVRRFRGKGGKYGPLGGATMDHAVGGVRDQRDAGPRPARVRPTLPGRGAGSGWEPVLAETGPGESGLGLTRQAVADGAGLVFAVGGDGTVRACAQALAGTGIPLAIVPLGTANLTARALGIPARAGQAIDAGFRGRERGIDLARRTWARRTRAVRRSGPLTTADGRQRRGPWHER